MYKKTKVVATIGPACWEPDMMEKMIDAGMNVARINMSHADVPQVERVLGLVRSIDDDVAVLVDLRGHKLRLNDFGDDGIVLQNGDIFVFGCGKNSGEHVYVNLEDLDHDVAVGTKLLVDDGKLHFKVKEIQEKKIIAEVTQGGVMKKSKTMNVPGVHLSFSGVVPEDYDVTVAAVKLKVDYIALSFVRSAEDVHLFRELIENSQIKIISKIEDPEGVMNFDSILEASDGVMVARGDLGVEIPAEKVPVLQKEFIRKCNEQGKPVIVATQMLESMVNSSTPTRAEVNDVANAIYDGADCVMLSGESSTGKFPVESVEVMARIAHEVEDHINPVSMDYMPSAKPATNAIASAVSNICQTLPIDKILVATATGTTAITLSRFKPKQHIYAFTGDESFNRRLSMHRGITAHVMTRNPGSRDTGVRSVAQEAFEAGYVSESDLVVIVAGANIMEQGATNMLEIQRVGSLLE